MHEDKKCMGELMNKADVDLCFFIAVEDFLDTLYVCFFIFCEQAYDRNNDHRDRHCGNAHFGRFRRRDCKAICKGYKESSAANGEQT